MSPIAITIVASFNIVVALLIFRIALTIPRAIARFFRRGTRYFNRQYDALGTSLPNAPGKLDALNQALNTSNKGLRNFSKQFSGIRGLLRLRSWILKRLKR